MIRRFLLLLIFGLVLVGAMAFNRAIFDTRQPLISAINGQIALKAAENLWLPKEVSASSSADVEVGSKAAFFVETQTGRVLYQKNIHQQLRIASLTKIMSVIVTMEHKKFEDKMVVSQQASDMEPDKMLLKPNETLSAEELLDGIFTVSANDAAEVLAEDTTGRREEFISMMNSKAATLGMVDTQFINPSGLEEDGRDQHSSAYDVALMSRYAISHWPHLVDISSQQHIYLPESPTHQDYDLYSGINLLSTYPGVVGFKTGFTPEAGLTLVTLARRGGFEVLGVLLGSDDRRAEARKLLDYSFKQLGVEP